MARILNITDLSSRIIRQRVTENSPESGLRIISDQGGQNSGGLSGILKGIGGLFGGAIKFAGWIIQPILSIFAFSFVGLMQILVQTSTFIYNFNINISDESIETQFDQAKLILAGLLGGTLGNSFGYLACGILPSTAILAFNEALGLYLLKEVGEEALEELAYNIRALCLISFKLGARSLFYAGYKNIRKAIKIWNSSNSNAEKEAINGLFGFKISDAIEAWGEKEAKPWSLRLFIEEKIDNIENPLIQNFVEEFYDESLDGCVEAGYVLAQGLDNWVLEQKNAQSYQQGSSQLIEIIPDREAPEERLIFAGNTQNVQTQIINSLNNYHLVDQRDVGQIIGEPVLDSVRKPPVSLSVRIYLRGVPNPPWFDQNGGQAKRAQVTIPNFNKAKLDWETIKLAVGGINGFLWGRFWVQANLLDGNKITFYAGSEAEGKDIAIKLIGLTNTTLSTLNITEEQKEGARILYPKLYKEIQKVYPASMVVINQKKILKISEGVATSTGMYKRRKYLIPLYTETKPENFNLIVAELSANPE